MATSINTIASPSIRSTSGNATTSFYKPLVLFYANSANITSATGGTLTTAQTITIPANILASYGNALEISIVGQTANNANVKSIGIKLGNVTAYTNTLEANSDACYELKFTISRYVDNTANYTGVLTHNINTKTFGAHWVTSDSFSSSQNLQIVYTSPSLSDNTIRAIRIYAY